MGRGSGAAGGPLSVIRRMVIGAGWGIGYGNGGLGGGGGDGGGIFAFVVDWESEGWETARMDMGSPLEYKVLADDNDILRDFRRS
jgi:hypothetical protein